ncbi:TRAP transporter small permease [Robertmurraya massiliosenegalensis]|uniref:TRAP transporter small permease n=1 Tax=Robertmurraya massiliosenegalensis TaxID=1287657 RepID=UPI0002ECFA2E|nr:TRAP transporter small permease subunit [Robertmurraya massiliosenegalensis]
MRFIDSMITRIEKIYLFLATLIFALLILINIIDIAFRLIVGSSITATQELSILCFSWMVFLGMAVVLKRNLDPKITLFLERFVSKKFHPFFDIVVNIFIIVFLSTVLVIMIDYLQVQSLRKANYIPINYMFFSLPVVFSFIYMIIVTIRELLDSILQTRGKDRL